MDLGIRGKRALVCAASRGLGFASAMALAQEGVDVHLCARNAEDLARAAEQISAETEVSVHTTACDLSQPGARQTLVEEVKQTLGNVDILVHNVGGPPPTATLETTCEQWQAGFERLFLSVHALNAAFVPAMQAQGWGRVVNITSITVLEPASHMALSNSMRAAVTSMAKTLSAEVARDGITVNCVAPAAIHTERIEQLVAAKVTRLGQSAESIHAAQQAEIPVGRYGRPQEFGAVVAFLCSQQAGYVTGSTISVDGGARSAVF